MSFSSVNELSSSDVISPPKKKNNGGWVWLALVILICALILLGVILVCVFSGKNNNTTGTNPNFNNNCPSRRTTIQHNKGKTRSELPTLNDEEFLVKIDHPNGETAVIMTYGAWCGWSKRSLPAFKQAALESNIPFYLMEDKFIPKMIKKYKIKGFPTFIKFKKGNPIEYKGNRSKESLVKFAKN